MPEALIFDFDGLILDTEVPVYEAWQENYRAHGQELPLETYVGCVGSDFNGFDPKAYLEGLVDSPIDWAHWDHHRETTSLAHTHRLKPFPGVLELLSEANQSGVPCVVASSSPRSWVEGHLDRLEMTHFFATTRCLDDVAAPKPAPDLFLAATQAVGVDPEKAIVLEDSLNGLKAAQAAGIDCVVVPNRVTALLEFTGAASILSSLSGIKIEDLARMKAPR